MIDHKSYVDYLDIKNNTACIIFEPLKIDKAEEGFIASHLGESKGYYFVMKKTKAYSSIKESDICIA